ncbi:MAG: hypothetical protein V7606_1459 [Burkholderiales bacterium]
MGLLDGYRELRDGRFASVVILVGAVNFKVFNRDFGFNLTYIPTISRHVEGAVAIQFKLRLT